jgi:predicted RND superfamily exporter protein
MNDLFQRYARLITDRPRATLVSCVLATALFGFAARHVRLDNNFSALFASPGPEADLRKEYRERFGPDDGLLLAIIHPQDPNDRKVIDAIEAASDEVGKDSAIAHVYSVTKTPIAYLEEDGLLLTSPPFGSHSQYEGSLRERLAMISRSVIGGPHLISEDGQDLLIVGELKPEYDSFEKVLAPANRFKAIVDRQLSSTGRLYAGIPFTRIAAIDSMQGDLFKLVPLTSLVMALLLFWYFRRFVDVVVPLLCVVVSIVATAGFIGLLGDNLNQLTIIYPILLMVVVVNVAAHFIYRFYQERTQGRSTLEAARICAEQCTKACFLTTITTVIGFASLMTADMQILHRFGLYLAVGVALSFAVVVSVIPASLLLRQPKATEAPTRIKRPEDERGPEQSRTARLYRLLIRREVAASALVLGIAVLAGSLWIARNAVYDYSLSNMLPADDPIAKGNRVVDEKFGGIIPVEVSFRGQPGDFAKPENLRRIENCAAWLTESYAMQGAISYASLVKALQAQDVGKLAIPADSATVDRLTKHALSAYREIPIAQFVTADYAHTRLRAVTRDSGARAIVALRDRLEQYGASQFAGTGISVRMTGEAPVGYAGINRLSHELVVSLVVALVIIIISFGVFFRSLVMSIVSILPNMVPVAVGLAYYTQTSTVLDPLPGIALCIALGFAGNDSIFIISRYREELAKGHAGPEALLRGVLRVNRAMIYGTVVTIAGFLVLVLSHFRWNQELGILGALTLAAALLSDLIFTPALLSLMMKRSSAPAREAVAQAS